MPHTVENPESQREAAVLSWIQQFAPYGVVTLDESFQVQSWNHWMEQHSGRCWEEVAGKNLFNLYPELHERKLVGHFERALGGESSVLSTALHRYLLPLPSPFPEKGPPQMLQTARIAPLFSKGRICGIVAVIEDVTQRESQAEALAQQHRQDELLSWALAHLLETEQPQKAVRQLFFKIAEQLDFDTFVIYLRDVETGQLTLEAVGGVPVESDKDFAVCPFLPMLESETQGPIIINSLQRIPSPEYATLHKVGVSAAVVLPLAAKNHKLGLLCFATCIRDSIDAEEVGLLTTIAQYLATALDRENTNRQLRRAKELLSDEAQLLEARVQERTARLQETITELETFSYTIAHDLRAPARNMTGYCDILLEEFAAVLPADARRALKRIANSSKRMENLTHDLLEFGKVSRGEIELSALEIEPILEDLISLRPPDVRHAINICRPLHPVQGHRGLLEQVFSNLIDNAVKFVSPGSSPKISISSEVVAHASPNTRSRALVFSSSAAAPQEDAPDPTELASQRVRIWVRDEGIGVAREVHQKIFGIFERGLTAHAYEGTGIGLAIVARAMQRMRGTCGVESEPGKGSAFWLELPGA
jgi:PAS domain S-box-containing protein